MLRPLEGFFAALIAGPETVMPSEYQREVFGGEMSDTCEFASLNEANEVLSALVIGAPTSAPVPAPVVVSATVYLQVFWQSQQTC